MASDRRRTTGVRLKALSGALARIERGGSGDGVTCDEPIGVAGLRVRPGAILFMAWQRQNDR